MSTEQNRTEQNRTEQNRTEQNRTEQNRVSTPFFGELNIGFEMDEPPDMTGQMCPAISGGFSCANTQFL